MSTKRNILLGLVVAVGGCEMPAEPEPEELLGTERQSLTHSPPERHGIEKEFALIAEDVREFAGFFQEPDGTFVALVTHEARGDAAREKVEARLDAMFWPHAASRRASCGASGRRRATCSV
jgi:hypothetical protein